MLDEDLMAHQTNADSKAKLVYKQQYSASEHYASPCLVPYSPELTVDSTVALFMAVRSGCESIMQGFVLHPTASRLHPNQSELSQLCTMHDISPMHLSHSCVNIAYKRGHHTALCSSPTVQYIPHTPSPSPTTSAPSTHSPSKQYIDSKPCTCTGPGGGVHPVRKQCLHQSWCPHRSSNPSHQRQQLQHSPHTVCHQQSQLLDVQQHFRITAEQRQL